MKFRGRDAIQKKIGRMFVCVLLSCALCCLSIAGGQITPSGTQCPTAQVQLVLAPVYNSCGCILRYEFRHPQVGDASFVQCRCAEKKSSQKDAVVSSKVDYYCEKGLDLPSIQPIEIHNELPPFSTIQVARATPPLLRPPAV